MLAQLILTDHIAIQTMVKYAIQTLAGDAINQQSIYAQQAMKFISKMFHIAFLMMGSTALKITEQFAILQVFKIFFGATL